MMQAMTSMGASDRTLKLRALRIVTDDLQGDQAEQLKARAASLRKMLDLEGKPLVIEANQAGASRAAYRAASHHW